ncbi:restriction endonuclease subunit S [Caldifermentibacillus hisashii]|uniref:restriction endonuclease subunit S n=1 Tax=Caldifermentibacillus hisashii TaxID=996558 RepID=UPI003136B520
MKSSEWKVVKLEDVCYFGNDKIETKMISLEDYISTENMLPNKGGISIASSLPSTKVVRMYEKNDVLISNIRPYFKKIWFARKIGGASNDVLILKGRNKKILDNKFMYYYLSQDGFFSYVTATAKGTKMPRGDKTAIMNYKINLPTIQEQENIVRILTSLDEKIEINNQINKKLEEMAQTIFKHWFVDFEFPNENGEPYKSSGGEMVESELGMIPKGWRVESLDKVADYLNGLAMQKYRPSENEKGIPVLKIKELRQGKTDENSDICTENIDNQYIVRDGDIIFSWSGTLLVDVWCGGKCGLNQHLFKVTSKKFEKWFYYHWTRFYLEKFMRIAESKATTMGHIKRKDLSDSKVLIPTEIVYEKINSIMEPLLEKQINTKIQSTRLVKIRDSLLPKLMSGEIRVPVEE